MFNMLENFIFDLQVQYKALLTRLTPNLNTQNSCSALDEINIFWYSNMDAIKMYLHYFVANADSFIFTASTFLDIGDNEQYPFILLGKMHIVDDPLSKYSEVAVKGINGKFSDKLKEQIELTAADNIRILSEYKGRILILPLRLLSQNDETQLLFSAGEKAFLSLFNGINDFKDYFLKCNTINDILDFARDDIENVILFTEDDDQSAPFLQRYESAVKEFNYMFDQNSNDAHKFFFLVYGYIQQSFDVLMSCIEYNCTPYLRNLVSFCYFMLVSENFNDIEILSAIRYKCCIAHLIYRLCSKEILARYSLETVTRVSSELNFQTMLFNSLATAGVSEKNFSPNKIAPSVEQCLQTLYHALETKREST